MKIFVAGATGTLGRPVVDQLLAKGHTVFGLSRKRATASPARPNYHAVLGNALDAELMRDRLRNIRPDIVVHLLTALPAVAPLWPSQLRATNTLRIHATANLIEAAVDAGVRRIVAESFVSVHYSTQGSQPADENAPLAPIPSGPMKETVEALRSLEEQLITARAAGRIDAVAMRIGFLYGSDVPSTRVLVKQARAGKLFLPRHAGGIGAFVHQHDAATAIVAAIEHPAPAPVYHVVDDRPMTLAEFAGALTRVLGLPAPRSFPFWVVKLTAPFAAEFMSARFVLSNASARRDLGWTLQYPTVWEGLRELSVATEAA